MNVFERFPGVWWPIQWSVALLKCLITQSEWVTDKISVRHGKILVLTCWYFGLIWCLASNLRQDNNQHETLAARFGILFFFFSPSGQSTGFLFSIESMFGPQNNPKPSPHSQSADGWYKVLLLLLQFRSNMVLCIRLNISTLIFSFKGINPEVRWFAWM